MTIKVTNDLMFKKLLASEEHKDILQGFIKDFCGLDVECSEIQIETPYSIDLYKNSADNEESELRRTERDIAIELRNLNIIVELQMYKDDYFFARTLHYMFERFTSNYGVPGKMTGFRAGKPDKYSSLMPVYAVNIVDGKPFQSDNDAVRTFTLYDTEHNAGLDKDWIRLSFFELGKARINNLNQKHWHEFFTTGKAPNEAPAYIKKAQDVTNIVNMSKEERDMLTAQERYEAKRNSEYNTALRTGIDQGLAQGIERGIERGIDALAELITQGVPLDEAVERAKNSTAMEQPSESTE